MKKIIISAVMIAVMLFGLISVSAIPNGIQEVYPGGFYDYTYEEPADISASEVSDYNVTVTYEIDEYNRETFVYPLTSDGSFPVSEELKNRIFGGNAIIGWKDESGHEYLYNNNSELCVDEETGFYFLTQEKQYTKVFGVKNGDRLKLTPIYTPVSILPEETFSFYNGSFAFRRGYDMTFAHSRQLRKCYQSATKKTPFGKIGVPFGAVLPPIYQIFPWSGSCCGFPIAVMMQHYSMIDLLSKQNAPSVSALSPSREITSALNFYNAVTPAAIVCSHKAASLETDGYKSQIKKLYETVAGGKSAVCFIHCGYLDNMSFDSVSDIAKTFIKGVASKGIISTVRSFAGTHCILFTGAYIDGAGNRILIGYDENEASYCHGEPQIYKVYEDFEDVVDGSTLGSLGSIAWFDDVSFLESFKADGETDPSAWYSYYKANKDTL